MANPKKNHGTRWGAGGENQLRTLAKQNTPTRVAAIKLGRTEGAVRAKAAALNISLKPVNQSPYNRQMK